MPRHPTSRDTGARRVVRRLEREIEFKLTHAYPLPKDFPEEFKRICELRPLRTDEIGTAPLQLRLGEIVYLHRRRLSDKDYFARIEQCIRSTEAAANELRVVFDRIMKVDIQHIERVMFAASKLCPEHFAQMDYLAFLKQIKEFTLTIQAFRAALTVGTGVSAIKRGKGRPRLPYYIPTLELVEAWEDMTSLKAVVPKGMRPGKAGQLEATQLSTEFIRLGLRMISPTIRNSEVMTSIKNALKLRRELDRLSEGKQSFLRILEKIGRNASSCSENGAS